MPNRRSCRIMHRASANSTTTTKGTVSMQQEAGDWFFTETGQKTWVSAILRGLVLVVVYTGYGFCHLMLVLFNTKVIIQSACLDL